MPRRSKREQAERDARITSSRNADWDPVLGPDGNPAANVVRGKEKYGERVTAAEMERRIEAFVVMIATGHRRSHLLEFVHTGTDWDVSTAMVDEYTRRARTRLKEEGKRRLRERIGEGVAVLKEVQRRAMHVGDFRAVVAAQKEIDRIHGVGSQYQRTAAGDPPPTPTEPAETSHGIGERHYAERVVYFLGVARGRGAQLPPLPDLPPEVVGNPN